ncbi:hypothetical protein LINPERPRIM_LOCUS11117 [Linum perenne]
MVTMQRMKKIILSSKKVCGFYVLPT